MNGGEHELVNVEESPFDSRPIGSRSPVGQLMRSGISWALRGLAWYDQEFQRTVE